MGLGMRKVGISFRALPQGAGLLRNFGVVFYVANFPPLPFSLLAIYFTGIGLALLG